MGSMWHLLGPGAGGACSAEVACGHCGASELQGAWIPARGSRPKAAPPVNPGESKRGAAEAAAVPWGIAPSGGRFARDRCARV
ncbi:unnamed protein product [Rangifer tarandus platyrhynchus]|uniref:Uncharacterized protein n=1 Tax=Rangifer tarandus platyrhynchus TaxID=3082113 RepID=A0ABN8ZM30_RANTA|nr:unnamed protein product [Rangifer tarandus platyrhynchus]